MTTIAPPKTFSDIQRFGTALSQRFDANPNLGTLIAHVQGFNRIEQLVSEVVSEAQAEEADWRQYHDVDPMERPTDVEDPGPLGDYYAGLEQVRGAAEHLKSIAGAAAMAKNSAALLTSPQLADQARKDIAVLAELNLR